MHEPAAATTALAGGMLAFALPFGVVSSRDGPEVRCTGAELATFSVPADSGSERELAREVEQSASPFALVALVAAAAGLGRLALRRAGVGACTWVALVAIQLAAPVGLAISATLAAAVWVVRFVAGRVRARPVSA